MSSQEPVFQTFYSDEYLRDVVEWINRCPIIEKGKGKLKIYEVPVGAMDAISDNLLDIAANIEERDNLF